MYLLSATVEVPTLCDNCAKGEQVVFRDSFLDKLINFVCSLSHVT